MSGDSGDTSSSDFSAKPSCSRRITRRSNNRITAASCSSSSNATNSTSNGGKKKRHIVMRIEFDDDSDESSTASSSGMSDDGNHSQTQQQQRISNKKKDTTNNSEEDDIKPCSSRKLRGKLGKKTNFVFSSDEDDVPGGRIHRRSCRRNRLRLEEDDAEAGASSNGREIVRPVRKKKTLSSDNDDYEDDAKVAAPSTLEQNHDEENGFNSDSSSNELLEKCPICLLTFRAQEIGSPATCEHIFCANCIEAWSKNVQTCPIDRIEFDKIIVRESYENRKLVREINVCKANGAEKLNHDLSDEDITHCEVCSRPDREDVMLLCDSCNQGYHIDCLSPPLSEIPEGSWYCDNCFDSENGEDTDMAEDLNELYEDIRDMGIPEARLRVTEVHQPRILRTRQNERIRAAILSRTRSSARNQHVDAASSSSRTASTSRSARTVRNSSRTARTPKTRRRRRRRTRQRTYVVEYDLNNFDEKFAIKTTKKVIRRRRRRRTQRTSRNCRQQDGSGGRMTASKRLAEQLGVISTNREARSAASSQSFSLFGNANDLEYFSDSDDGGRLESEIQIETGGGGTAAVQTSVRISNFRTHRTKKGLLSRLERSQPSGTPDLLSNIMDLQDRWHNASRHLDAVRIGQDGSLNLPPPSSGSFNPAIGTSPPVAPSAADTTSQPTSAVNSNEITQAPMYPRGGGGNNRNFNSSGGGGGGGGSGGGNYNNRYNNQSNYRGGSGGNSGGGQYRNSGGSGGGGGGTGGGGASGNLFNMVGRGNFSFSSPNFNQNQNNDNNNSANNSNTPNNRDRFNPRNNRNNRNALSLFNTSLSLDNQQQQSPNITIQTIQNNQQGQFHNQTSSIPSLQSMAPIQRPVSPNITIQSIQTIQHGQFQHQSAPIPSLQSMPPIQPPVGLFSNLPPPLFGPPNMPIPPILSQPPPIMPMHQQQTSIMPPLAAPPAFNSSLLQLTADYGNDEDDDSNCPNFSVYSMESLQVAQSDVKAAVQSKGETPKEDDENEDLVQLSDDDETMGTYDEQIPLPPTDNHKVTAEDSDLYEPDQPTIETDDESAEDDRNKDECNDDNESQMSPENDMELESQDTASEQATSEVRQEENDKPVEDEGADGKKGDGNDGDELPTLLDIKLPTKVPKLKRTQRKGVLELYDDSDWEELNMEKLTGGTPPLDSRPPENDVENNDDKDDDDEEIGESGDKDEDKVDNDTEHSPRTSSEAKKVSEEGEDEEDKEQDRSYTPCLDEKNDDVDDEDHQDEDNEDGICTPELLGPSTSSAANLSAAKDANTSDQAAGIAGMETELISEDEDPEKRDKRKRTKSSKEKEQFKKVSKNQKDRNYRTEKPPRDNRPSSRRRRSRSRTNDKENNFTTYRRFQRGGRFKRREIPRYNVRNIVNQQRTFKDRYGRDTSRPARSTSRTRRRRSFSRSNSRSKSRSGSPSSPPKRARRSFSMSPTPAARFPPNRRQTMSPRRRSLSPIQNRSPIRRQTRTPLRMRSRSNSPARRFKHKTKRGPGKRSFTPPINRARSLSRFTPRLSRSRTPPRHKAKRPKDRKKKKNKKRQASPISPPAGRGSPAPRRISRRRDTMPTNKRKRHHTPKAKSPIGDQGWSPSPSPQREYVHDNISWTPPLMSPTGVSRLRRNEEFNEFSIPSKPPKEKKKREKKKKKSEKRRAAEATARKEKRRRGPQGTAPSKEVFASGNNILVSVSFNKDGNQPQQTTVVTLPPTREEVLASIRGRSTERQNDQQGKKKKKKRKKLDTKPVAIIDLERSPFQITQEQADVIVLTDSEGGQDDENLNVSRESANEMTEMDHHHAREGSSHRTVNSDKTPPLERLETIIEESYENAMQQQGPKTPPEPPSGIKFNLINKNKAKANRNALHDDAELDDHHEEERQEERDPMAQGTNKIGPNTPPESGPCSPDVYDPFDPTKSPSMSPRSPTPPLDISHDSAADNDVPSKHSTEDLRTEARMSASSGQAVVEKTLNPVDLVMALMNSKANTSQESANKSNDSQYSSGQNVVVNLVDESDKAEENSSTMGITVLSNVMLSSGKSQHIPSISSPPLSKASSQLPKQPQKITNILSGLPGLRHNGEDLSINDIESPYSPGSADYEDLFEPPPDTNGGTRRRRGKAGKGGDVFTDLFGSSTPPPTGAANLRMPSYTARKRKAANASAKNRHKTIVKVSKLPGTNTDDHVKVYDDLPNSAVELQVKDKFLRKLNRQERVVEEVKMILKPRFNRKQITKDDYKEIMRRAVPKICHSKSGEINPKKIQNLIEAYVKKFRQKHKKLNIPNTGQVSSAVKCAAYLKKL